MKQHDVEIFILGSGTCIPSPKRGAAGIVINIDDVPLLFDSGSGVLQKLAVVGIDYQKLQHLFYTHTHPDHSADLIPILQAMRISPHLKRIDDVFLYGPKQFSDFLDSLALAYGDWVIHADYEINITELSQSQLQFPFGTITTSPMQHSNYSIGFRLETTCHKKIVYSGDTDYCDNIIQLAADSDVLILECSFPDELKMNGHLTPTLAATIAAESGCNHLLLTHLYPACENIDIMSICRKIYSGNITIAHDLMRLEL